LRSPSAGTRVAVPGTGGLAIAGRNVEIIRVGTIGTRADVRESTVADASGDCAPRRACARYLPKSTLTMTTTTTTTTHRLHRPTGRMVRRRI